MSRVFIVTIARDQSTRQILILASSSVDAFTIASQHVDLAGARVSVRPA